MPEKGKARAGEMALGLKVHTALAKGLGWSSLLR